MTIEAPLAARASASARVVLLARMLGLGATLVGSIALARALGPDGRGTHAFFVAATVILVAVTGLSLPVGGYILRSRMGVSARPLAVNAAWLATCGALVATLAVVGSHAIAGMLPQELIAVPGWPLALFLAVAGFGLNAHQLQLSLAAGRALLGAFLSFGIYSIAALGYVVLLATGGGLPAAIWIVVAAPYLAALTASFARPRFNAFVLGAFDRRLARQTLRQGLRFYPGELASILYLRVDVIVLGVLAPAATTGIYVVAYQTAEPMLVIASAAQAAILAMGGSDGQDQDAAVARLMRETLLLASVLCLVAALLAPVIIPLLYGDAFTGSVAPFLVLLPAVLALAIGRIAAAELTRRNLLEVTVLAAVAALVAKVGLNLLLIPALGAVGAALSSLGSYGLQAVLAVGYLQRDGGVTLRSMMPGARDLASLARGWDPRRLHRGSGRPPGGQSASDTEHRP